MNTIKALQLRQLSRPCYLGTLILSLSASMLTLAAQNDLNPVPVAVQTAQSTAAQKSSATLTADVIANPKDQLVAALQQRLWPFLHEDKSIVTYHAQKASAWLSYAAHEGSERSLSTARQQALHEAQRIIEGLERGQAQQLTLTTPILSVSSVMRRDLWVNAELLKQHPGFSCAQSQLAQAEVMLVWAAAEHCELGWRHSRELFLAAQRLIDQANEKASACAPDAPKPFANVSYPSLEQLNGSGKTCQGVVGPWPIWSPQHIIAESIKIKGDESPVVQTVIPNVVHFALDQARLSDSSKAVLNQIADFLQRHEQYTVTLYGFTDQRASVAYNLDLSQRRSNAVSAYLQQQGIAPQRIATEAKGKTQLVENDNIRLGHGLSRRVELVYVNAEGQDVSAIRQNEDVQLEKSR